ncbi:cache domain-containing sensor histidine kinase [Paenibacillus alginolyticus]|uniref:cache domain-containing sensor histidine kinase n=1 Tax=Paenibacillus alginolyticus TaxID=59839 RepID=UPI001566A407
MNFNLDEIKRPLVQLVTNASVIESVKSYESMNIEERINNDRNIMEINSGISSFQTLISDILLIGRTGYINNLDGRKSLRWDYPFTEQPWFLATQQKDNEGFMALGLHKQDYYLDNYISRYNQYTLSIAMPVFDYQKQKVGAVICDLDLKKVAGLINLSAYEKNGQIFLLDQNGTIIVDRDTSLIGQHYETDKLAKMKGDSGSFVVQTSTDSVLLIYHSTAIKGWKLVSAIPMSEIKGHSLSLKTKIAGIIYLCLVLNIVISMIVTFRLSRPVKKLLTTLDQTANTSLKVIPKNYVYKELNQIGDKFVELMGRIQNLVEQNYISQLAWKESELRALQSQINPHFLFNTLQLLQTEIVYGNTNESNDIILSLSNLLRYSTRVGSELVELQSEINYLKDYLFILTKKFNGNFTYEFEFPDESLRHFKIIKLILQPIVENCIKHGFGDYPARNTIHISVKSVPKGLLIYIEDNGKGIEKAELLRLRELINNRAAKVNDRVGLQNVHQRIQLKFGCEYGLYICSLKGRFTRVYALIPRIEREETV